MKLSTKCRYGTRLLIDLAEHYNEGPIQIGDIAERQEISVKYLEQIIKRKGLFEQKRPFLLFVIVLGIYRLMSHR